MYHYLTSSQDLIFLCITDEDFDRSMAFHYLDELKRKFESLFTANQAKAAPPFGLNNEFSAIIEEETNVANDRASSRSSEKVRPKMTMHPKLDLDLFQMDRLRDEVQQVKDIMVANIDSIVERGEKMELLVDKTEQLSNESVTFRQRARSVTLLHTCWIGHHLVLLFFFASPEWSRGGCGGKTPG